MLRSDLRTCVFSPDVEVHVRTFFDEKGDCSHHQSEGFWRDNLIPPDNVLLWTRAQLSPLFLVKRVLLLPLSASTRGCERFPGASGNPSSEQRLGVPAAYWWRLCEETPGRRSQAAHAVARHPKQVGSTHTSRGTVFALKQFLVWLSRLGMSGDDCQENNWDSQVYCLF